MVTEEVQVGINKAWRDCIIEYKTSRCKCFDEEKYFIFNILHVYFRIINLEILQGWCRAFNAHGYICVGACSDVF